VLPELAREPELVEMFLHEARLAASLDSRNIVAIEPTTGTVALRQLPPRESSAADSLPSGAA
jgi:hypothetical protein